MEFLDLKDISERYMELINPTSTEKIIAIGKHAGLKAGQQIIDYGTGFGEVLVLWAQYFEISGIGIDIRRYACQRARQKISECGLSERLEIVHGNGAEYQFEPHSFDVAACIGASFIWGGYLQAIRALKQTIRSTGRIIIGEPYWVKEPVPEEYLRQVEGVHTEYQLLQIARQEGFDFEYMVRASQDDWDRYEAGDWYGLMRWIEENPEHPERQQVIEHLRSSQEDYLRYGREYLGWAIYVLTPLCNA